MDARKRKILKTIIREHIKCGFPVSSNFLVAKTGLELSPATVRNEMMNLEEYGLLSQPHISSGRIPTEEGYQFYVDNFVQIHPLNKKAASVLRKIKRHYKIKNHDLYKMLAKTIASISGETVIIAFGGQDIYYTGFSNFFSKPELEGATFNLGNIIDKMNDVMYSTYHKIYDQKIHIMLGKTNPFGDSCASVLAKVNGHLIIVLGLLRMNYDENISLLEFMKELLSE